MICQVGDSSGAMIASNPRAAEIWLDCDFPVAVPHTNQRYRCNDGIHLCHGACPPHSGFRGARMRIRLTRRWAPVIDGVNLLAHNVGDVFDVTRREAELLIAEEWAVPVKAT